MGMDVSSVLWRFMGSVDLSHVLARWAGDFLQFCYCCFVLPESPRRPLGAALGGSGTGFKKVWPGSKQVWPGFKQVGQVSKKFDKVSKHLARLQKSLTPGTLLGSSWDLLGRSRPLLSRSWGSCWPPGGHCFTFFGGLFWRLGPGP